jgi:hypothetical protein
MFCHRSAPDRFRQACDSVCLMEPLAAASSFAATTHTSASPHFYRQALSVQSGSEARSPAPDGKTLRFSRRENHTGAGTRNTIGEAMQHSRRSDHVNGVADGALQTIWQDDIWREPPPAYPARARRDAPAARQGEAKSPHRVFADVAAKLNMTEESLRRNPTRGLTQLFSHFGPSGSRSDAIRTLSVHPVFLRQSDLSEWQEIFGIASAQEEGKPGNVSSDLQMAVQELVLELLQLRHGGQAPFRKMCRGVFSNGLRQRHELAAVRAAMTSELLNVLPDDRLEPAQARWCAQLILSRHEPSLGRMDAPATLVFGSPQQLYRHLAIIDRTASHLTHWALPERTLLQNTPPPNAPPAEIGYAALRFAYAQGRGYLLSALANRTGGVDPAITAYAIEDLRKSLRSAGIADRLLPPGAAGLETQPQDWIERLDWVAFNGPDFLLAHGATTPYRNTLAWWMRAIDDCFGPDATLDVREADPQKRNLFVDRVLDSQAFGGNRGGDWDPRFAQSLFNAFLRHYVAPLAAAPFERALCRAIEPLRFLRCSDPAVTPGLQQILRSFDEVKEGLRRQLFKDNGPDGDPQWPKEKQQWAVQFLCSIYAPALAIAGLPGQTGYGSAGHTAVELALFYPGIPLANLTMEVSRQLLETDSLSDLIEDAAPDWQGQPPETLPETFPILAIVKRMAHAHGVIDARQTPMPASAWEEALQYFNSQMQTAAEWDNVLNITEKAIVNRKQSVTKVLLEMGYDPEQTFTVPAAPFAYLNAFVRAPLDFGKPHTLYKFVVEEALPQLLAYGDLNDLETDMLNDIRTRWPKEALLRRCRSDFDTSLAGLIATKIMPALRLAVQALPADDQEFLQCGEGTIQLPRATLLVGKPSTDIPERRFRPKENVIASGAVLVDLRLRGKTRHYWAPLQPLGLMPYNCSKVELIKKYLPVFFQTDLPDSPNAPKREILGFDSLRNFYAYKVREGQDILTAIVGHAFSEKKIEALYKTALGETDTERSDKAIRDFILGIVPGYGCADALTTPGQLGSAPFICTLDAAGTVPIVKIGVTAADKIMRIAQRAILTEMAAARLGRAGRALGRGLTAAAGDAYSVALKATRQTLGYLDPGMTDAITLWRLGKTGLTLLKNSVRHIPQLQEWRGRLDRIIRLSDDVFPERDVWRARPEKCRTDRAGNTYLRLENRRYEVVDLDDMGNVLVIPDGAGRVRPVDPESGLPCGLSRRRGAMVRVNKPPGRTAAPLPEPALCRPKRSPRQMGMICTMDPAPHLGDEYYAVPDTGAHFLHQALSSRPGHLLEIDPASAVYRSYTVNGGKQVPSDIFLHDSVLYRRLNSGHVSIVDAGLDTDDLLVGRLSFEPILSRNGNPPKKAWYVQTEVLIDRTRQGDGKVTLVNKTPYSDSAGTDGTPLGMVELYGDMFVFKKHGAPQGGQIVKLERATEEQISVYTTYGVINSYDYPPRIKNSIRRLYDMPMYRSAMHSVMERFDEMLENALRYYESPGSVSFLRQFVAGGDLGLAEQFRRKLIDDIVEMQKMMPHLKKYSADFIAIADLKASGGDLAASLNKALVRRLYPWLLNKPLMIFDETELAIRSLRELARYFGHEATHLIRGAFDGMEAGSRVHFYAMLKRNGDVDISSLLKGAQEPHLDASICASVLEHCMAVGDAMTLKDPRVRPVAEGDSRIYNGRGDWREKRSDAASGEAGWNDEQLRDVVDLSHILISRILSGWSEGVKKKT